ncbi:MAG: TauD/TfdA dioxygenase family protein [Alphaproteobacteria bacterium]
MDYDTIDVRPLTPRIGAEIHGIDITKPLTNRQVQEVHDALAAYLVIFFRDQHLDFDSHKIFGRYFGDLARSTVVDGIEGHPEIVRMHADANSKYVAGEQWHSDLSCNPEPPMGSILYLHTVPPVGGDTLFANMYAAYDALSAPMKAYVGGLTAVHDAEPFYRQIFGTTNKPYPVASHPIVRIHPVTKRKALYVNEQYTTRINDVSSRESDAILAYLHEHCHDPAFQVRFRWRAHSVAFWDNRCTQHHAVWDYHPQVRSGNRVSIKGDKPYGIGGAAGSVDIENLIL